MLIMFLVSRKPFDCTHLLSESIALLETGLRQQTLSPYTVTTESGGRMLLSSDRTALLIVLKTSVMHTCLSAWADMFVQPPMVSQAK